MILCQDTICKHNLTFIPRTVLRETLETQVYSKWFTILHLLVLSVLTWSSVVVLHLYSERYSHDSHFSADSYTYIPRNNETHLKHKLTFIHIYTTTWFTGLLLRKTLHLCYFKFSDDMNLKHSLSCMSYILNWTWVIHIYQKNLPFVSRIILCQGTFEA